MEKLPIRKLILGHLDGRLSDRESHQLEQLLQSDSKAREEFKKLARLDTDARQQLLNQSYKHKIAAFVASGCSTWPMPRWAMTIVGVVLLAAVWLLTEWVGRTPSESADNDNYTRGIAVISAEAGTVWSSPDQSAILRDGVTLAVGTIELKHGLAQIDFFGGASLTLSGPAQLELVSADQAVLHRGKLKANVPPAARGFELRSNQVLLEDLGTSFGLSVDGESADLFVFGGEVRATGTDGNAVVLLEGDSVRLKNGEATLQDADLAGEFPDIADVIAGSADCEQSRYTTWKQSSLDRRRDPRLVAYYDFEDLTAATRRLPNQALHGGGSELDGGIVGARVAEGRWAGKTALDFRAGGDRVRFRIPGEFEVLSLYAWVRIDALDRHFNSLFLTDSFDENEIHWQVSNQGALHFACSPKGENDLAKYNRRFYSDVFWDRSKSGQWFLLATTVKSGSSGIKHYVNGEAVGFSGGANRNKPLPKMRIGVADLGNWSNSFWPNAEIRTLNGRIDEFAIYSAVLSPQEIADIYEQGQPKHAADST